MKRADCYAPDELPTKPGTPEASARKCKHCGQVYGWHAEIFPRDTTTECFGVRSNFEPEPTCDADRER